MRVAEERGTMIGQEVGYHIRFDDCTDPQKTAIKVRKFIVNSAVFFS